MTIYATKLFDIVNHLNLREGLTDDQAEREALAELNLRAGQKAKASAAYEPASRYLADGINLIAPGTWQTRYELCFALCFEHFECEYLLGHYEETERIFEQVLAQAKTLSDKGRVYAMRVVSYATRAMHREACDAGRAALAVFGVKIPATPNKIAILSSLLKVKASVGRKPIESLVNLPNLTNPDKRAVTCGP